MASINDNPERAKMLKRAIAESLACHEPPSFGLVSAKLPGDYDLLDEELSEAIGELKAAGGGELPTIETAPATPQVIRRRETAQIEPHKSSLVRSGDLPATSLSPENAPTPARTITRADSQRRVEAAHARLGASRVNVRVAQEQIARAKGTLAECIMSWQQSADPISPELRRQREARAMIETSNRTRAQKFNRVAITSRQFVQKRMQNGANRGAYSQQQAARVGFRIPGSKAR